MKIEVLSTDKLGDRSYIVHDGQHAVVVDPQRDIDRVEEVLARYGVQASLVVESHMHNDYVTGGYELARQTGARYAVNADDAVSFDRLPVRDGDILEAGTLRVGVMATPGHTFNHLSYTITDTAEPEQPPAVFTGGSLLFGSVGRTDLLGDEFTDELTHAQFHSAHRLADALPDDASVYPTHGFGSFCSSGGATGGADSTIGEEKQRNDAFTATDEQSFVDDLVANLTAYPAYYAHMTPLNMAGPTAPDMSAPEKVDPGELGTRISAGEWVVDLRDRVAYASDHVAGTISIELGGQFATYLGWLAPWGAPITLVGDSPEQITDAQRELIRIGIDHIAGAAAGSLDTVAGDNKRGSYSRVDFADVAAKAADGDVILDVRRNDERVKGHITGSVHVPIQELLTRLDELPAGRLWVHCASGFRASIGASLLDRAGRDVVHIDDDYSNAAPAGLRTS